MELNRDLLSGGDPRSIGNSNEVVLLTTSQHDFDMLFRLLFSHDRLVAMRCADAIEKITSKTPGYLAKHKTEILELCKNARHKELQWHLALILPRLALSGNEFKFAWRLLSTWATDTHESKIVRVNAISGLAALTHDESFLKTQLYDILEKVGAENIPSLNARVRKIKNEIY